MFCRTEGIVLKNRVFAEADLIVTYFTKDSGILSAIAKSPRKTKSRFGSSLEPLTMCKLTFLGKENSPLPKITQADIIKNFQSIRDNYKLLLSILDLIELNFYFLEERQRADDVFELLHWLLLRFEAEPYNNLTALLYKLKLLYLLGHFPSVKLCARCATPLVNEERYLFSTSEGSLICKKCASVKKNEETKTLINMSKAAINFCHSLMKWEVKNVHRIKVSDVLVAELDKMIDGHIRYLTNGKYIPMSEKFIPNPAISMMP